MKVVREICGRDPRYSPQSYVFVLEALDFTAKMLDKPTEETPKRHVGGGELLGGIRAYALQEFGPMALTVLRSWGITRTEDFGEIVFNLVEAGKLRKTDKDRREDFAGGYDFEEAFAGPFQPDRDAPARLTPGKSTVRKSRTGKRKGNS